MDSRVFAVLGKATPAGILPFGPDDIATSWAVTAESGCIRLERLSGHEEVTGLELLLPTPFSYDYGVDGVSGNPELVRTIFGLTAAELEEMVTSLRRGSFPVLGFSDKGLRCAVSCSVIPAYWPHIVLSNLPLYGNVVSVETFVRILVSSLPHSHSTIRYPGLMDMVRELLRLMGTERPGLPYSREMSSLAPMDVLASK